MSNGPSSPTPDAQSADASQANPGLVSLTKAPLGRSIAKVIAGNFTGNGLNLAATILVTNALRPEAFGIYTTLLTPLALIAQLSDFGLNTTIIKYFREWTARGGEEFDYGEVLLRRALFIRLAFVTLVAAIGIFAAATICEHLLRLAPDAHTVLLFRAACAGSLGMALWYYCQALMQAREEFGWYAGLTTANHALRLAVVGALATAGALTLPRALAVFALVPLAGAAVAIARWPRRFWTAQMPAPLLRARLAELARFSRWIFLSAVLTTIMLRIDAPLILRWSNDAQAGQFGNAANFAQAMPLLAYALSTVLLPRLAVARGREELRRARAIALRTAPALVVIAILYALAVHIFVPYMHHGTYIPSLAVFNWLLAAYAIGVIITPLSYCCFAFNKAHWITAMNAGQLALTLILEAWLVPRHGAAGAGMAALSVRVFALACVAGMYARLMKIASA